MGSRRQTINDASNLGRHRLVLLPIGQPSCTEDTDHHHCGPHAARPLLHHSHVTELWGFKFSICVHWPIGAVNCEFCVHDVRLSRFAVIGSLGPSCDVLLRRECKVECERTTTLVRRSRGWRLSFPSNTPTDPTNYTDRVPRSILLRTIFGRDAGSCESSPVCKGTRHNSRNVYSWGLCVKNGETSGEPSAGVCTL